ALGISIDDECVPDTGLLLTHSDGTPTGTCPIIIVRTYTVSDICGSSSTITHTFNLDDTTPPSITGTIAATDIEGCSATDVPTALNTVAALEALGLAISDNCTPDASLTVTASDGAPSGNCPIVIIRTYTIADLCGNSNTITHTYNVEDTTPPAITGIISATNIEGCSITALPSAVNTVAALEALGLAIADNCTSDAGLIVTSVDGSPNGTCPIVVVRTYTITDQCGNSAEIAQTFNIDDRTPPVFSTCPGNINAQADAGLTNAMVNLTAPVYSDNCTAIANISVSWIMTAPTAGSGTGIIPSPFQFNVGVTTVTYTATDECGNTTDCQFTVTVTENDIPEITCSPDVTVDADAGICSALVNPIEPTVTVGEPVTWSWSMTGATIDAGTGP
ncbi:MAG: hypothetical protein CVU14_12880, partial [Bacteroidetes bacterium HGW-Bacteroidetes-9]